MPETIQPDRSTSRPNLPVNLLIEQWPCLVVGGGSVAHRKVTGLIASGGAVHVVSPALCPDLAALAAAGRITHAPSCFTPADVQGKRIVFAATNDRQVNRQVLEAARAAGAFCCCVDGNWTEGDFTTPAVLQQDGLTVAVSTGGQSCRRARMVKDTLSRHIRSIETADLLILGTSHDTLPLERRENLQLTGTRLEHAGNRLMHVWGVHEFMLLTTCNRVELVAVASASASACGLLEQILGFDQLADGEWYRLTGVDAYEHLALVTAGMRSQSPGEYHVAAQVKAAMDQAAANGWTNGMMHAWVADALHISKHIKNEVAALLPPTEIEDLAIDYITEQEGPDWKDLSTLVLGTGMLGHNLVENTVRRHGRCTWCYHMNRPTLDPGWEKHVSVIPLADMPRTTGTHDIIFCALDTAEPVLGEAHIDWLDRAHPRFIMDLGMPRNVDPSLIPHLAGTTVVDLDQLKSWAANRQGHLDHAMAKSRDIVHQHREGYASLIARFQGRNKIQ